MEPLLGRFKNSVYFIPFLLFVGTVASRLPFMSDILYNLDSVSFALATEHYDIAIHQPHPPGYFLYVMAGKLLNTMTGDANRSFVLMSVLSSGLAVAFLYLLAREMFDERVALWSSLLLASSPFFWHFGEVATTYALEAFFSVFFAYICFRINKGEQGFIWLSAVILSVAGGIRQSTAVLLFPLWLFSIRKASPKKMIVAAGLAGAVFLLWYVPMVWSTGGFARYRSVLDEYMAFTIEPLSLMAKGIDLFGFLKTFVTLIYDGVGPVIIAMAVCVLVRPGIVKKAVSRTGLFIVAWSLPMAVFFFFFPPFLEPRYVLITVPIVALLSVAALISAAERIPPLFRNGAFTVIICIAVIFNLYVYFVKKTNYSRGFLDYQKRLLMDFTRSIRENFSPKDTVILSVEYLYMGQRHLMHYLPEFKVFNVFNVRDKEGRKRDIYWGTGRMTYISKTVEIPKGIKYFISPFWDPALLRRLSHSEFAGIGKISSGGKAIGFYGDIRLAPKLYDVPFTFE